MRALNDLANRGEGGQDVLAYRPLQDGPKKLLVQVDLDPVGITFVFRWYFEASNSNGP